MNIKKAIKNHKATISSVAKQLGITQSALSQQINNNSISFSKVEQIAGILGISVSEFCAEENKKTTLYCPYCGKPIYLHPIADKNPSESK